MTITYDAIATYTTTGTESSFTFSSITSAYTDLVIIITGKAVSASDIYLKCNGDNGTNYTYIRASGNNSSTEQSNSTGVSNGMLTTYWGNATNDNAQVSFYNLMDYSNTTTFKSGYSLAINAFNNGEDMIVSTWRDTSAITSLTVNPTNNFVAGTVATIYGIKKE